MNPETYNGALGGPAPVGAGDIIIANFNSDGTPQEKLNHAGVTYELIGNSDAANGFYDYRAIPDTPS
ncbi:hypothetical protein [Agromyces lapidis]|uniref:CHAP domain-containing protein n=1 Tax=Agromyces lapidis TaxID=279574 RepID=A0ABV5SV08_9MICO|nr:hypothetical protein [Agromyces lapidis]